MTARAGGPDPDARPSWMEAPGFVPHPDGPAPQAEGGGTAPPAGGGGTAPPAGGGGTAPPAGGGGTVPPAGGGTTPMPGAPPYPPHGEPATPAVGEASDRTGFGPPLAASAVWAAVLVVLVVVVSGAPPGVGGVVRLALSCALIGLLTATVTWVVVRKHAWPFWVVVLVAAPIFWLLRTFVQFPG